MPSPKDSEMEGDKVSAYEQEALAKKEKWRRGTFQEMSELLNKDSQDTAGLTAGKQHELPRNRNGEIPRLCPFLCGSLPEYEPFAGCCIYPE